MTAAGRYFSNVLKTKYQTFETYARATQKPKLSYRDGLQGAWWSLVGRLPAASAAALYGGSKSLGTEPGPSLDGLSADSTVGAVSMDFDGPTPSHLPGRRRSNPVSQRSG